jgi:hypothetical protein
MNKSKRSFAATVANNFAEVPAEKLHFHACAECGVVFGLPAPVYLRRLQESGTIFCPAAGHPNRLDAADLERIERGSITLRLLGELHNAKCEISRLLSEQRRRQGGVSVADDRAEMTRRLRHLVNFAPTANDGRLVCRICQSPSANRGALKAHLKREHMAAIAAKPAEFFD